MSFRRFSPSVRHPRLLAVLSVAAAALLVQACRPAPAPAPAPVSADTWAVVDGRPIVRADVEKAFRRAADSSQTLSEEEALTAKLALLDDLIVEDILVARARGLKTEVPETEVDAAFADAKKNIPDDAFQQELTRRNLSVAEMRDGLRRQLLTKKLLDRDVVSTVNVSEQEVTDFFNANRAQFNLPEEAYHLAQIVITPVREPQPANRTGDDAATPEAATAKVAMLLERLKQGAPFAALAMDFSEDPESAQRGGDLGLVPMSAIKQAPPALREAVMQAAPGTARVARQNGAHTIVFVVSREPAGQRDLSSPRVREQITSAIRSRREQLLRNAYLTAARSDAAVTNYLARRVVQSKGALNASGETR